MSDKPLTGYPRDLIGYGETPQTVQWPGGARIAVQFVMNYEEGGENCILHGDAASETFLSELSGARPFIGKRHMSMESIYEYGSRVGVWRVLDLFREWGIPITVFGVAMAMERNPAVIERALKDGHEICSHGYRWVDYADMPIEQEREYLGKAMEIHKAVTGERPYGWYCGRTSENTRTLVTEEGGFLYDADDYSDDLPFWSAVTPRPQLIVPYTLDNNDMQFATPDGFTTGDQFYSYLKDAFDCLYELGEVSPSMMSIGLHPRIIGRPGRLRSLQKFVAYIKEKNHVWCARRIDIARFWSSEYPHGVTEKGEA